MNRTVVAFLGSSSVAGRGQAYDWIAELQERPQNAKFEFCKFGVGGDLACNALERVPRVLASRPNLVFVWIGGNDVLASVSEKVRRFYQFWKHLRAEPSAEGFSENLRKIVCDLKSQAKIALCSLSPIGEDPFSNDPFQRELNRGIEEYSATVRSVALEQGIDYVPIFETMLAEIRKMPGRPFTEFRFLPFYRDAIRSLVLRRSVDEIARVNGWSFHTDGVHLNRRGGLIVSNLVQRVLDQYS